MIASQFLLSVEQLVGSFEQQVGYFE